ncbi:phosphonate metabolism protein PhnI [Naumannella sp. ID2617S]|uniref:Phosphonate metabolism protein PhnI n=1 Tax=Enemella dayhoffiae TaxID=2016507 RepID=A0A255HBQ3_9ACTN|nr:carbon-phosphorus lyase complex subunit PhnI [Enemella dayhoffiae]NNG19820.1 phosphonate metabolism protein PhnI [Naumannella sp. ID2617S]OYO25071.1 phosphonate metabolism protein PhnI [Enemella dayhoffiae]
MTYAGTNRGGTSAILAAEALVHDESDRFGDGVNPVSVDQVERHFPEALDRLMGEAFLWDRRLAAIAFLQARGDLPEAVHLLRAHRSTLPRLAISEPVDPDEIELLRRIVPAHRSPDGPQLLGRTVDYTARLLRAPGTPDPLPPTADLATEEPAETRVTQPDRPPQRYSRWLAERGLLMDRHDDSDPEPFDLSLQNVTLPAPRSALLSAMAMAETGGLIAQWYRNILGPDGYADEAVTLGDVRHGRLPVRVTHPHTGNPVVVGKIETSECEAIAHLDERGEDTSRFDVGFGMAVGHNERKAISMSVMDLAAHRYAASADGTALQQLIMMTTDGLASNGFLEHLKLPHYVTFRSMVDRAVAAGQEDQQPAQECTHDH